MQILLNGFISGLSIALLAVAFQIVYLPTRIFFIGLAGLYAVAPYVGMTVLQVLEPWPVGVAVPVSVVASVVAIGAAGSHALG